ncbi:MAG: YbjN domain-containing protein [Oscillospiraceae bacterium]|nr:YbjN domain-containing protein [Ruminococcus sp.]MCD8344923.1 YbjN domain-containing protein [Oscillospiraceae bacterium]
MNALLQKIINQAASDGWQYNVSSDTQAVIRVEDNSLSAIKTLDISITVMPECISCMLAAWGLVHVSEERRAEAEALCNSLNSEGYYSIFFVDEEDDISARCRFLAVTDVVPDRDGNRSIANVQNMAICRALMLCMVSEVNSVAAKLVQISR